MHLGSDAIERFGELVAEAGNPIDDVRGDRRVPAARRAR